MAHRPTRPHRPHRPPTRHEEGVAIDLRSLEALIAVARTGSLSGASRALSVPRTSVRRRLDSLEALVGTALVQLSRDGACVTPAGRVLIERGSSLATNFGNLVQAARTRAGTRGGRLRLLLPHGFAPQVIGAWYARVRRQRPQLQMLVRFHRALDELNPEEFDIALQFAHRPPPGPWRCRVLCRVATRLMASDGYLAERGCPTSEADLHAHDLALWVPTVGDAELLPRVGGGHAMVHPTFVSANIASVRWLGLSGQALCFMPDSAVTDVAQPTGDLRPVLDDRFTGEIATWAVVPEVLAEDPNVRWMLDSCVAATRA